MGVCGMCVHVVHSLWAFVWVCARGLVLVCVCMIESVGLVCVCEFVSQWVYTAVVLEQGKG